MSFTTLLCIFWRYTATWQHIDTNVLALQESNYFEEAFKAYEKGISLFKWPYVYDIWNTYLTKFLQRYQGNKIERARDLFEQVRQHSTWEQPDMGFQVHYTQDYWLDFVVYDVE